jgi:hypothetical protein
VLTYRITRVPNGAYVPYHTRTQRTLREIKIACAPRRAARGRRARATGSRRRASVPLDRALLALLRAAPLLPLLYMLSGAAGAPVHTSPCVRAPRPCAARAHPAAAPPPALLRAAPLLPLLLPLRLRCFARPRCCPCCSQNPSHHGSFELRTWLQ